MVRFKCLLWFIYFYWFFSSKSTSQVHFILTWIYKELEHPYMWISVFFLCFLLESSIKKKFSSSTINYLVILRYSSYRKGNQPFMIHQGAVSFSRKQFFKEYIWVLRFVTSFLDHLNCFDTSVKYWLTICMSLLLKFCLFHSYVSLFMPVSYSPNYYSIHKP